MNTRRVRAALSLVVIGALLGDTQAGCSSRPPSDEIYLYYYAGTGENKEFGECVEPGTEGKYPIDDEIYTLPTSARTWNVVADGSGDSKDPFVVGSAPGEKSSQAGPQMVIWATVDFYLNTYCGNDDPKSPIVQFWQRTGSRYHVARDGEGNFDENEWKKMLQQTLVPVELGVLQSEARKYVADDLDTNANGTWEKMEAAIGAAFNAGIRNKVNGDYFCGTTFDRTKPDCPPVVVDITSIDYADPGIQQARNQVRRAEEEAKARLIAAQAEVNEANIRSKVTRDPNYLRLKELEAQLDAAKACAANPNCTLIIGVGNGVNINSRK